MSRPSGTVAGWNELCRWVSRIWFQFGPPSLTTYQQLLARGVNALANSTPRSICQACLWRAMTSVDGLVKIATDGRRGDLHQRRLLYTATGWDYSRLQFDGSFLKEEKNRILVCGA